MPAEPSVPFNAEAIARDQLAQLSQSDANKPLFIGRLVGVDQRPRLYGGVTARVLRSGPDGRLRVVNANNGDPMGVLVEERDAELLADLKRTRADEERPGGALPGILLAAGFGLLFSLCVLYGVWQHGRSYGQAEQSSTRR